MRRRRIGALAVIVGVAWGADAWACGAMFPLEEGTGVVQSADYRAVILPREGKTTLVVQVGVNAQHQADFAWVLPVPGPIVDAQVATVGAAGIDELLEVSDPTYVPWHGSCIDTSMGMYGCAGEDGGAGDDDERANVDVLDEYTAGPYDILLLSAGEAADVTGWLQGAGYAVPSSAETLLDAYAADGWLFLAVRVAQAEGSMALPALAFTYESEVPVYPLRLSSESTSPELEIALLVIADARWEPADGRWAAPAVEPLVLGDDFRGFYSTRVREAQGADGRRWALEYADGLQSAVDLVNALVDQQILTRAERDGLTRLTRYRSWVRPAELTDDLRFVRSEDQATFRIRIDPEHAGMPLVAIELLGLGALLRLRRRRRQRFPKA